MSCGKPVEEDEEIPRAPLRKPTKCLKCKAPEVDFAIPRGPSYCKACQLNLMESKFKRHIISLLPAECPRDSSILAGYSGSPSSDALIDLLRQWLANAPVPNEKQPKHVISSFTAVHVYHPRQKDQPALSRLAQLYENRHKAQLSFVPLSAIFEGDKQAVIRDLDALDLPAHLLEDDSRSAEEKLNALLDPLSPTSRSSLTALLRTQLLARLAEKQGHAVMMFGDTSTKLASHTLSNIALGRGWSLGEEVSGLYRHSQNLLVSRPLSSFLSHEIAYYIRTRLPDANVNASASTKDNIDGLIEDFVNNLQEGFPATVSTIARTSEKLGMRSSLKVEESGNVSRCALCHLPSDPKAHEWPKMNSITNLAFARNPDATADGSSDSPTSLLAHRLCYGCIGSLSERTKASKASRQNVPMPDWMSDYMLDSNEGQ